MKKAPPIDLKNIDYQKLLQLHKENKLTEEQKNELLILLEGDLKERAFKDYALYAREYIKITDKKGEQVLFKHNPIQKKINDQIKKMHKNNTLVRIIILKGRQHGVTTDAQGRMLFNAATKKNRSGLIIAHDASATNTIFEKTKYMHNNLPQHIRPLTKASNAKELIFDTPTGYKGKGTGMNSKIEIQVAGDVNVGRSKTLHYVHASEFSFWPSPEGKEPIKQLNSILNAVADTPDTEVVIESTANGYNDFMELWDAAVAKENEWVPLFFPWHENPEYVMECTEEEYQKAITSLKKEHYSYLFGDNKKINPMPGVVSLFNLSKKQIRWWIWTIRNKCSNDLREMKQENPSIPEDAFKSTGNPVFDNERVLLRITYLRQFYKNNPPKKGKFLFEWKNPDTKDEIKDKSIRWVDDPNGFVTIYEDRKPGVPYVIGGDTKGEGRDFYAGCAINNITGNRAATIRNQWTNSKPYTWQMYCLGIYYNLALIGIEMNWNTGPIEELERLHYPRHYTRRKYDDLTHDYQLKHGWKTDGNTRPLIIDKEVHLIEENIDLFNDIEMLQECITFVEKDGGRPDAMSGKHDDALFADMISAEIRGQQSFEEEVEEEKEHRSFDEDTERGRESYLSDYDESPFD
jgi:hypothetical protein